ncbi:MAG: cytochrome P450 [Acidobacteria bacterium]|nr:cytochrome P450 [Acidobacteriota bacterium]
MTDVQDVKDDNAAARARSAAYGINPAWGEPDRAKARASIEPMEMYLGLQAEAPIVRDDGHVTLLRMEDILWVNKHRDVEQATKFLGSSRPAIPLGLDGPEHTKYRRLLDPVFTAKRVAPLADSVRDLANEMIDGFIADGEVDAYTDWCEPLPSTIFLRIMGLPEEDLPGFLNFKNLTLTNSAVEAVTLEQRTAMRAEAVEWIHGYFNDDLDRREKSGDPGDNMLGWLMTTEVDGHKLNREEILDILGLLIIAGLDTVAASLADFLSYFARFPEQRQTMLDNPALWPNAVEELMRYESPVTDGSRIALTDLELPCGEKIKAGTTMHISWSSANLDPAVFPNPLEVDLNRTPNKHIGFASGWHRCLGSHLARMEMVVAMQAWHDRIPNYRIKDGVELVYSGNPRAPHHFPLVW